MTSTNDHSAHGGTAKQWAMSAAACFGFACFALGMLCGNADVWTWSPTETEPVTTNVYMASLGTPTYGPLIDLPAEPSAVTAVTERE